MKLITVLRLAIKDKSKWPKNRPYATQDKDRTIWFSSTPPTYSTISGKWSTPLETSSPMLKLKGIKRWDIPLAEKEQETTIVLREQVFKARSDTKNLRLQVKELMELKRKLELNQAQICQITSIHRTSFSFWITGQVAMSESNRKHLQVLAYLKDKGLLESYLDTL